MKRKQWEARLKEFWSRRSERERWWLAALLAVLLVTVGYEAFWRPAQLNVARLQRELPGLRDDFSRMQAMAVEVEANRNRSLQAEPTGAELESRLLETLKGAGQGGQKLARRPDGRFVLEWREAPFSTMADWLDQIRQNWHVTVVEGHVERGLMPGNINARMVLRGGE